MHHSHWLIPSATTAVSALLSGACAHFPPPPLPDPELLGCYDLGGNLPGAYADSLGYEVPDRFRLEYRASGQWMVMPTDYDYHPYWTTYDQLPSSLNHRRLHDDPAFSEIHGDSIDVYFPGDLGGALVLRLGPAPIGLGGRAEWLIWGSADWYSDPGVHVTATPASCEGLPNALTRIR